VVNSRRKHGLQPDPARLFEGLEILNVTQDWIDWDFFGPPEQRG